MKSLRAVRRSKDMSAEVLAEKTGINWRRLLRIERGESRAFVEEGIDIADALGASVRDLVADPAATPKAG